jgi:hypothetical protein
MPPEPYDSGDFDVGNSTDSSIFPNGSFDYDYLPPAAGNKVTLTATFPTTFPVDQIVYVLPVDDMIPPTFYRAIQNVPEGIDITNTAYWEVIDYVNVVGSFDYTEGIQIPLNNFFLNRPCATANRLWVTLNGFRLQEGREYTVENNYLILGSGTISPADILVVTEFTCSVVPDALAFRIFQDMRGIQSTYRITPSTTTLLSNSISATDDEIYVSNINALTQPNLEAGIFGVITIDGERIMYRDFDPFNSKISGLLRGTAGTAAASHAAGAIVYNMGRNNLLQPQYQDYIVENSMIADGVAYTYYAPDVTVNYDNQEGFDMLAFDVASINGQSGSFDFGTGDPTRAVLVYVGGILQTSGYALSFEPVVNVTFFTPPTAGYEITILARKGLSWYQPGIDASSLTPEPSNGVPLQETDTDAARFLRGLI